MWKITSTSKEGQLKQRKLEVLTLIICNHSTGTIYLLLLSGKIGGTPSRPMKLFGIPCIMIATLNELFSLSNDTDTLVGIVMFMDLSRIMMALGTRGLTFRGKFGRRCSTGMGEVKLNQSEARLMLLSTVRSMSSSN